jgi:hypothetical protein
MPFSKPLRTQERVDEVGQEQDGEDEPEGVLEAHRQSLSQARTYHQVRAKNANVSRM